MKVDIDGERINWLKVKWIRVCRDHPDCIFVNYAFQEGNFFQIDEGSKKKAPIEDYVGNMTFVMLQ